MKHKTNREGLGYEKTVRDPPTVAEWKMFKGRQ
jgi:hypothetical protein